MKRYVVITQQIIAEQGSRSVELKNEVEACERLIEALQLNVREAHESVQVPQVVSQCHSFMQGIYLESGGEIVEKIKDHAQANTAENEVLVSQADPCPSPNV